MCTLEREYFSCFIDILLNLPASLSQDRLIYVCVHLLRP